MIGHRFSSGAVCVALAPGMTIDDYIILSVWRDEYVVAHISPDEIVTQSKFPEGGEWWGGHYHHDLPTAVRTFAEMTKIGTDQRVLVKSITRVIDKLVVRSLREGKA